MSKSVPKPVLEELRQALNPTPVGIVQELVRAGYEAYIVGGAVRDLLLGREPKDYDISTSATPEEVRKVFGRRRCHVIGRRFRLAHVYANHEIYEVSTFRRTPNEKERQGKKHDDGPIIWNDNAFGTLEDDARRRDFTVNALYLDVAGKRGIIDFSGGYADLHKGIVRCIGEPGQRMDEDPVHMLRALKLVGQCGFRLDPPLEAVIREKCREIKLSSPARLFEELLKLLANPDCGKTLQVMHDIGFLHYFWPVVDDAWDDQEGVMMQHLLKLRGDAMRRGRCSNSRGLALSTVALPFMMSALNPENPSAFWTGNASSDPVAHRALGLVFDGITVPRLLSQRILQIVGLVPRLLSKPVQMRYLHHAEYRYGRALLALVVQCFGWDSEKLLADMPELSPAYCNMEDEEGEFWQQEAEDDGTLAPVALPRALVPIGKRNTAAKEVSEEKDARKAQPAKPRARKKSARKISPDAPENSPALHEDEDALGREDSPVVEKAAPPPSATFFETAAVKLPPEKKKRRKKGECPDSITFG